MRTHSWSFRHWLATFRYRSCGLAMVTAAAMVAGSTKASDCCAVHNAVGCDNPACTASVCSYDPACCDRGWDHLCVDAARHLCSTICDDGCSLNCDGDLDDSNSVDARDLSTLLSEWNLPGRCSDLDGNGVTGAEDIAYLIAVWGQC